MLTVHADSFEHISQVNTDGAQLAQQQAAIDYCFKPALQHQKAGIAVNQAVLNVLAALREVAYSAQVAAPGCQSHAVTRCLGSVLRRRQVCCLLVALYPEHQRLHAHLEQEK